MYNGVPPTQNTTDRGDHVLKNDILEDSSNHFGKHIQNKIEPTMEIQSASHLRHHPLRTEEYS